MNFVGVAIIAALLFGVCIGIIIGVKCFKQRPIGYLRVDCSDQYDAPYLFLELDAGTNVNTIIRSEYVTFRVKLEDFIPHK